MSPSATVLRNGLVLVVGGWYDGALASAELYDPASGSWTTTGTLAEPRSFHTATLLADGKVLVAGGSAPAGGDPALASAELYDPETGRWTVTGAMVEPRAGHTATLLDDGRVLVTGGEGGRGGGAGTAELYDPATRLWTGTGNLGQARPYGSSSTLLPDGQVLVVGGGGGGYLQGGSASAELYDPASGKWEPAGQMMQPRIGHSATLLPDGDVLIAGGGELHIGELFDYRTGAWSKVGEESVSGTGTLLLDGTVLVAGGAQAVIFDPSSRTWADVDGMSPGRTGHAAALLPNGLVLVAGGSEGGDAVSSVKLFDPTQATRTVPLPTATPDANAAAWTTTGRMINARSNQTASLLGDGTVLVVGGQTAGPVGYLGPQGTTSTELYDPTTGLWVSGANMLAGRLMHTATQLAEGDVLVAGGGSRSAELYSLATRSWSAARTMLEDRLRHTATLLRSGKVLVTGGCCSTGSAELFDPATNAWSATGSMSEARSGHTATLLPDGRVLVAGGLRLSSAELYDPATGRWTATGKMATARSFHTATLLPDGRVLVVGGQDALGSALAGAELYDPRTGIWAFAGRMTSPREFHTATLLADGTVLVASQDWVAGRMVSAELFDPATGRWTTTAAMVEPRFSHTATLLSDGTVLVAGGERFPFFAELYHPGIAP